MMEVDVKSADGENAGKVKLPGTFEEDVRSDIIKKVVASAQSSRIQPKGSDPRAGMDTSAETPDKGSGQTRIKRIKGRRYHAANRAAWAPNTYDGRRAHPPKSEEYRGEDINKK